ncbi:MAG: hypothetical protein V2I43_26135 [Parvularcula sp.]|nr:hypothetical protein [Parvularcula sp.]
MLSADGSLFEVAAAGPFGARYRKPLILIARSLCHHEPYHPPGRLPGGARDQAALLAAEVNPPFEESGSAVVKSQDGYALWSWNQGLVDRLLGDRAGPLGADMLPETLFHDPADGLRVVELDRGVEAQAWRGGSLLASMYVPGPMSDADWRSFLGMFGEAEMAGHPPRPVERQFVFTENEPPRTVQDQPLWRRIGRISASAMAVLLVMGAVLFGETLRLRAAAAAESATIARLDAARSGAGEDAEAQRAITALRSFRQHLGRPDPVALLAEAKRLAAIHGLEVTAFTIDDSALRVGVSGGSPDALGAFALALEQAPSFTNVSPQNDRRTGTTFFLAEATGIDAPGDGS